MSIVKTARGKDEPANAARSPVPGIVSRFRSGVFWNLVSALFTQGSVFLINLLVAHMLGQNTLGEYAIIYSTVLTCSTVAQLATGYTATKFLAEYRTKDKDRAGRIVGLCAVLAVVTGGLTTIGLALLSEWLARSALDAPYLGRELALAAPFVLFSILSGLQVGILSGLEAYNALAKASIAHSALHLGGYLYAISHFGLRGACVALGVSAVARCVIFQVVVRRETARQSIRVNWREGYREWSAFVHFTLPAALSGLTVTPVQWLTNLLLVNQPGGFRLMGLWSAVFTLKTVVMMVPLHLNNVGIALVNNQRGSGDVARYRTAFWWNFAGMVSIAVVGAVLMTGFGSWFLRLFGETFVEGYPALVVLSVAAVIEIIWLASYLLIQSQGRMWITLGAIVLPRDVLTLVCALLFVPLYGITGLALGHVVAWSAALLITIVITRRLGFRI